MNALNKIDQLPPGQRFDYFDSLVSETFCPMACEPHSGSDLEFTGAIRQQQLGEVSFAARH